MKRTTFALACFSCLCSAQTPPAHVLIGGGLLGKLDGFCETPTPPGGRASSGSCPTGRIALGGLYGLQQEVQKAKGVNAYVLLTGNNLPKDFNANLAYNTSFTYPPDSFMGQFQSFNADVIALGQDDLLRAIFPAKLPNTPVPPARFSPAVQAFLQGKASRFLASNAAIRTNKTGMNKTWYKGYELMVSADQSIPWTTAKLTFAVPPNHHPSVQAILSDGVQSLPAICVDVTSGSGTVPVVLKPKGKYSLTIGEGGSVQARFEFQVDAALTPWDSGSAALNGLPVALLSHPAASPLLVASLIDPAVLDILDPSRWKDKDGDGSVSLVLYPPLDTAKALLSRAGKTDALPVLISDLNDALAAQVASSSADWRVVSFGGDSHLLGCESGLKGCAKGRSDYRSGAIAILNGSRVWARPEWIGETLIDVAATSSAGGSWENVSASWREVLGGRFTADPNQSISIQGKMVQPPPPLALYFARPKTAGTRIWWSSRDDMAVVVMDAMRKSLKTDLAMADERVIDPEVIAELNAMAQSDPPLINTIGAQELMEILWRHDPYTVIKITGKDLVTALGKLAKVPADEDSGGVCVRGLGGPQFQQACSIPETVKSNVLEINARYFNPDEYYSVAIPQSLARAAGLAYPRNYMVNVFSTVLRYALTLGPEDLDRNSPETKTADVCQAPSHAVPTASRRPAATSLLPPEQTSAPVAAPQAEAAPPLKWPNRFESKLLSLIFMPPASIELAYQDYHVPNREAKPDTSGFAAIPLVGEKAQRTYKLNMAGELHVIPIDLQPISLDVFSRVNLNRLETFPNSPTGFTQFTYTPDQWTNGAALRSKIVTDALTKGSAALARWLVPANKRPSLRLQPFVGYFDDTSVYHYTATYGRKSDSVAFEENDAKPNYAYFGMGLELSPIALGKYFSVNNTRLEQDFGMNYAAPKGVDIGGTPYNMEDIRRCGVQNLIDGTSGCTAAAEGPHEVRYRYVTQRQSRRQFVSSLVFAFGPDNKKETFTLDVKANQWGEAPGGYTALDPVRTAEFTLKSSFPIGAGIAFGPYFRYLTVNAFGSDGNFTSWRYGFMLTVPLTGKTGHGRFFF